MSGGNREVPSRSCTGSRGRGPASCHPRRAHGAVLVDLGCGAGLLAPHLAGKGYRHVGVDLSPSALGLLEAHGVTAVRGDVLDLPLPDGVADVVSAGEILEHVTDLAGPWRRPAGCCGPGGTLVIDTIAATWLARLLAVEVAERIPGGAPPGIHDPALFVDRRSSFALCAAHGVALLASEACVPRSPRRARCSLNDGGSDAAWSPPGRPPCSSRGSA